MLLNTLRLAMAARENAFSTARLTASPPGQATAQKALPSAPTGLQKLNIGQRKKDGVLYVPPSYSAATPAPLVLTLHGAGGNGMSEY